jgi:hypothetical protein
MGKPQSVTAISRAPGLALDKVRLRQELLQIVALTASVVVAPFKGAEINARAKMPLS